MFFYVHFGPEFQGVRYHRSVTFDRANLTIFITLPSILNIFLIALFQLKMYIVFERVTNFANCAHFKILMSLCRQAYRPDIVHGGHNTKVALVTHRSGRQFIRELYAM